jgi:hypothetical protein
MSPVIFPSLIEGCTEDSDVSHAGNQPSTEVASSRLSPCLEEYDGGRESEFGSDNEHCSDEVETEFSNNDTQGDEEDTSYDTMPDDASQMTILPTLRRTISIDRGEGKRRARRLAFDLQDLV